MQDRRASLLPLSTRSGRGEDDPLPIWALLGLFALLVVVYLVLHHRDLRFGWLEDLPVYKAAVQAYTHGADPYAVTYQILHFVYPPVVLACAAYLVRLMPGDFAWVLLVTIHIVCVLAAPLILARYYVPRPWLTPLMAMLVWFAEPLYTGVRALFSANIAPSLYFFALLAALPGLRNNRWYWFYVIVFLAGVVKITMVLLLLFPLLAGRRQWLPSALTVAAVAGMNKLQQLLAPNLYAGYQASLLRHVAGLKLYGYGVFGTAAVVEQKIHHDQVGIASYAIHILFAVTLLVLLFWLRRRGAHLLRLHNASFEATVVWLGLIVIAAILLNPRVLHYDMYLALFAAFVLLATTFRLRGWKILALLLILYLPGLVSFPHTRPMLIPQTWQLLITLTALGVGIRRMWQETEPAQAPAAPAGQAS